MVEIFYEYFGIIAGVVLAFYGIYILKNNKGNLVIPYRKLKITNLEKYSYGVGISMSVSGFYIVILEMLLKYSSLSVVKFLITFEVLGVLLFLYTISIIQSKYTEPYIK